MNIAPRFSPDQEVSLHFSRLSLDFSFYILVNNVAINEILVFGIYEVHAWYSAQDKTMFCNAVKNDSEEWNNKFVDSSDVSD